MSGSVPLISGSSPPPCVCAPAWLWRTLLSRRRRSSPSYSRDAGQRLVGLQPYSMKRYGLDVVTTHCKERTSRVDWISRVLAEDKFNATRFFICAQQNSLCRSHLQHMPT